MWRQLSRGLRALMHRSEADQEVADEVQHYLEQATQARMAEGRSRAEARRAAQLEIGGVTRVREAVRTSGCGQQGTFGMYADLKERARSVESVAVLRPWDPTMTGQDQPERFAGQRVSASYFHVLGVLPALGRDFEAAEDRFGGPRVVLLS